jgi:tRNA threonylcarbamoyladenosine biosynthesis protein TsaE
VTHRLVVRSDSADETRRIGRALGEAARPGDVLLLEGAFGVGKTVLVQGLAAGLDVEGAVTSPSFVLMVQHRGRLPLYHLDLYRLDGHLDDEMLDTLADAEDAGGVCAVEWPESLPPELRRHTTTIQLTAVDEDTRELKIESPDERLVAAVRSAVGAS